MHTKSRKSPNPLQEGLTEWEELEEEQITFDGISDNSFYEEWKEWRDNLQHFYEVQGVWRAPSSLDLGEVLCEKFEGEWYYHYPDYCPQMAMEAVEGLILLLGI